MSKQVAHWRQDVHEAVTRTINWAADLNGSTISSVSWNVPAGLTTEATSNSTTLANIRLAAANGGVVGQTFPVECTVTTAASEDLQVHFLLTIND
jgi:hypothetical protein